MAKYLSGRSKLRSQSNLTADRYKYLGVDQAEPNLGDPSLVPSNLPSGQQYQVISVYGLPGQRYWIPVGGGLLPGAISVFDEGIITPSNAGISSISQLNFVGAAISAKGYLNPDGSPGIGVTIRVFATGSNQQILFNNNNEFGTSSLLTFDNTTGILTAGKSIYVGTGGTVITGTIDGLVGIGTSIPTQEFDINGDVRIRGTIYDYNNQPGLNQQVLLKNNFGGVQWTNQSAFRAGAGGTYTQVQYHNASGLVDGALNFVYDPINIRVGIGSTLPRYVLDVLGDTNVSGLITASNLYISGISTFANIVNLISNQQSTSTNTGALIVSGGVGILRDVYIGGNINATSLNLTGIGTIPLLFSTNLNTTNLNVTGITTLGVTSATSLTSQQLSVSGITTLGVTSITSLTTQQLNVLGITTLGIVTATNITSQQLNVSGVTTLGVTSTTNFTAINITSQQLNVSGVTTLGVTSATNLTARQLNVSGIATIGIITTTSVVSQLLNISGVSTFSGNILPSTNSVYNIGNFSNKWDNIYANTFIGQIIGNADSATNVIGGYANITSLVVSGVSTFGNSILPQTSGTIDIGSLAFKWNNIYANYLNANINSDIGTITNLGGTNINYTGIGTIATFNATTSTITNENGTNLNFSGVGTIANLRSTNINVTGIGTVANLGGTNINYSGVGTITTFNATTGSITNLGGTNINYSGIGTITTLLGSNINFSGIGTIATLNSTIGTITTLLGSNINYSGVGTIATLNVTTLSAGTISYTNSTATNLFVKNLFADAGIVTYVSGTNVNYSGIGTIANLGGTNINYSGVGTITTLNSTVSTLTNLGGTNINYSGIGTITTFNATAGSITNATGTNLNYSGIGTITTLNSTVGAITNLGGTNINYSGIGTITTLNATTLNAGTISYTTSTATNLFVKNLFADAGIVTYVSGTNVNYSGIGTIANLGGTNINYTGVGTIANLTGSNISYTNLYASGISTFGASSSNTLTINSSINSNLIPSGTTRDIGSNTNKWNNIYANSFVGQITGNADTATKLSNARTISITGDLSYTSGAFDGTANVTGTGTLANTGVTAGTYGSNITVPQITVDAKGRITSASSIGVNFSSATVAQADKLTNPRTISITGDLSYTSGGFDGTANVTGTGTLANTGVTAATYGSNITIPQITVDAKGRITSASSISISGVTAGGVTAAGANTQIQFNNSGVLGASPNFTFNSSSNALTVTGSLFVTYFRPSNNVWHTTPDNYNRFYFGSSSRTYFGSGNGYEWRSAADANIAELSNGGNLYVYGDIRSPIFYDQNNTGYYTDPASTSNLNALQVQGGALIYNAGGGNYNEGIRIRPAPNGYSILALGTDSTTAGTQDGQWTLIRYPPSSSYQFSMRYVNDDRMILSTAGDVTFSSSLRTPIYYDSNNTGYYCDPTSTSNFIGLTVTNRITGSVTGCTFSDDAVGVANIINRIESGFYQYDAPTTALGWPYNGSWTHLLACTHSNDNNYYSMQFAASFFGNDLYYRSTNGNGATGWNRVVLYNNNYVGDLYGSVLYDSNDTGYYLDPNSTSQAALRVRGGALHGPNPTWGAYLLVGGDGRNNYIDSAFASVCATNGNLHMDAASGYATYINHYDGNAIYFGGGANNIWGEWSSGGILFSYNQMRSPIYYDYNDTGYYCDPNGFNQLRYARILGDWSSSGVHPEAFTVRGTYASICLRATNGNQPFWLIHNDASAGLYFYGGRGAADSNSWDWGARVFGASDGLYLEGRNSLRSPIFYDTNDTGYYCDPNNNSNFIRITTNYTGSTTNGNQVGIECANNGGTDDGNVAAMSFHCKGYWGTHFHLRHDSYIGIGGWSASSWRWYVQTSTGNMTAAGDVTAFSDIRLKEEIEPLQNSLSKLMTLTGISFKWKNLPEVVGHPGKKDYGIIAQEVEKIFPEVVYESPHESPDGDKYKTVAYDKIVPILIEAIKEQQNDINNLKQQIKQLKTL